MKTSFLHRITDITFILLVAAFVFMGMPDAPYHADESDFIYYSKDYFSIVYDHDISPIVDDKTMEYPVRVVTAAMNSLMIGFVYDIAGMDDVERPIPWHWGGSYEENVAAGAVPSDRILNTARVPSTLFTVLSAVALYSIALRLSDSRWAAWIAGGIYVTNPAVLLNGRCAMREGVMLFMLLIVLLVTLHIIRVLRNTHPDDVSAWWYVLFGVVGGLAVAGKLTSILIFGVGYLVILVMPLLHHQSWAGTGRHLMRMLGAGFLAILVFVLFNPVWWHPLRFMFFAAFSLTCFSIGLPATRVSSVLARGAIAGLIIMLVLLPDSIILSGEMFGQVFGTRRLTMQIQAEQYGALGGVLDHARMLVGEVLFITPQFFGETNGTLSVQTINEITHYESSILAGRSSNLFAGTLFMVLLVCGGIAIVLRRQWDELLLIALSVIVPVLALFASYLPWQRYYLIIQPQIALLCGLGFGWLLSSVLVPRFSNYRRV